MGRADHTLQIYCNQFKLKSTTYSVKLVSGKLAGGKFISGNIACGNLICGNLAIAKVVDRPASGLVKTSLVKNRLSGKLVGENSPGGMRLAGQR